MKTSPLSQNLQNKSLRTEFKIRGLDPFEVIDGSPEDVELENRKLERLLKWVLAYSELGSRKEMEKRGYEFPPFDYDIDPDVDWQRFERWINGEKIRGTYREQMESLKDFAPPDSIPEEKIEAAAQKLLEKFHTIHVEVDFVDEVPPRILYEYLWEMLDDESEFLGMAGWHIDACSGFCPECIRRPWCDVGGALCFDEDEAAGAMALPDQVRRYVSASPVSLQILKINEKKNDIES